MQFRWFVIPALVSGVVAPRLHAVQQSATPCAQFEAAVRANRDDIAAAVSLGQCTVRDEELIAPGGDSTRLAFRTNWNPALQALRRVVQVDASNARAHALLFRMLFAETRDGCSRATGLCLYVASVIRDGDTLITVPQRVPEGVAMSPYDPFMRATIERQGASLNEAVALADRWVKSAPNDHRPRQYRGQALLRSGQFAAAADALEEAAAMGTPESRRRLFWDRFEALVKADRGTDARRLLDEAAADPARDTIELRDFTLATLNALVGRLRPPRFNPAGRGAAILDRMRSDSSVRARPSAPPAPREPTVPELLAAGDTAGARRVVARMDSMLALPPGRMSIPQYDPYQLQIARFHLALGDTVRAAAKLDAFEQPFQERPFQFKIAFAYGPQPWLGGAWILMGDLAVARGRSAEAARMYRRVVGLWGGGDVDFQPVVNEARLKLDALPRR